jgi:hypothetical protein
LYFPVAACFIPIDEFGGLRCHRSFDESGEEVTEITYTWNIDRFPEFNVTDPSGNVIHVANYPELHIAGFWRQRN